MFAPLFSSFRVSRFCTSSSVIQWCFWNKLRLSPRRCLLLSYTEDGWAASALLLMAMLRKEGEGEGGGGDYITELLPLFRRGRLLLHHEAGEVLPTGKKLLFPFWQPRTAKTFFWVWAFSSCYFDGIKICLLFFFPRDRVSLSRDSVFFFFLLLVIVTSHVVASSSVFLAPPPSIHHMQRR